MAKVKNNNFLDTVHTVFSEARKQGALHLYAEDLELNGVTLTIDGKELVQFGSTGYLGLEQDLRLKEAAIAAIHHYGTQFPLSKSYVSHPLYEELESLVTKMYACPIVITKNSTLGHMGAIPAVVSDRDAIVLDHQVHWSVQAAAKQLKSRSVPIEMIRHNRLDLLEEKIKRLASKVEKIWYMADGIYSMFGDQVPMEALRELMQRYPSLHVYVDDVHGMSWKGPNGTGFIREQLGTLPDRVVLTGTLGKTFGAGGAVIACQDSELQQKIKTFGGPLTFSVQLEPATVGAAIASAKIHLSAEIYQLQQALQANIQYLYKLLIATDIPLVAHHQTPIFYIAAGMPITGYELIRRMKEDGFYINIGIFPGVPIKQTGLRITVSRLHTKAQLKALVEALEYHYPLALSATGVTQNEVRSLFQMPLLKNTRLKEVVPKEVGLQVTVVDSIRKVAPDLWNTTMGKRNVFDWQGMRFLEEVFSGNRRQEHNWSFRYVLITDSEDVPVLVTFLSKALWKEDMLSPASVSERVEQGRLEDPYLMTSQVVSMGCSFTEGAHYYLHHNHPNIMEAWKQCLRVVSQWSQEAACRMVVLRDFDTHTVYQEYLLQQGFVPIAMPETATITLNVGETLQAYFERLSYRSRKHFRKDIVPFCECFEVLVQERLDEKEQATASALLEAVRKRNLGLNTFSFPEPLIPAMNAHPHWEFIKLRLLPKYHEGDQGLLVGVMFAYKNQQHTYTPAFIGMDYAYTEAHQIYRQLLYQTIVRAHALGFRQIDFGLTAGFEKKKLGARIRTQLAFVQTKDNFIADWLELMQQNTLL